MNVLTRRRFIEHTAAGAAGAVLASTVIRAEEAAPPGDGLRFALLGCGGRGRYVARGMIEQGATCATLCDLHAGRRASTADFLAGVQAAAPTQCMDMQQVFEDGAVDFVIVATPDHWHAAAAIRACVAGKDVYVEKPHCITIPESRRMIEAARAHKRILQVGTQNRSAPYNHAAREHIRSGAIGDIRLVKVFNLKPGGPFRLGDPGTPPEGFNWDAWLGGTPERPYHQRIFEGGWHHFWAFSGGDLCDDGIHQLDLALMLMGDPGLPRTVYAAGGRLQHRGDDSEVPDVLEATFEFDDFLLTFEHANYPRYMQKTSGTIRRNDEFPYWTQNATRIELYGSERLMIVGRHGGGWVTMDSGGRVVDKHYGRPGDEPHCADFLAKVRSRERPTADIETLHPGACLVHMANIAHRVGNDRLEVDTSGEAFVGHEAANALRARPYRAPYGLPDPA